VRITSVHVKEVTVPLKKPFTTALRSVSCANSILVRVGTDAGLSGYGEAPPTAVITGETKGSIRSAIEEFITPAITGRELEDFDGLMAALQGCVMKNTSAKAAVDMALYDLLAQSWGLPLWRLLGGARRELITDITISLNDTETMTRDAVEAVHEGYAILKVKVGKGGLGDVDSIAAIRAAVGPAVKLRVDANQGWDGKQSVRIIRAMEDRNLDIELVEQPVPAHDIDALRTVTQNVSTPILADEAVFSAADAIHIIRTRAADFINIKLMKTGGIWNALKICAIAETYRVQCMMGCMLETKLAVSAGAHLAGGKNIITMTDLDGPSLAAADPYTGGPVFTGPHILLPNIPGIGIQKAPGFE